MLGLVHYNPALSHQVDHAQAFADCGFDITPTPEGEADIHIVSGPHFALRKWRTHPRVLMIDRAWWGDPNCVSIGWLQPDGTRIFARGMDARPRPICVPWKTREQSCLVLADYGQDVEDIARQARRRFHYVRVRRHPAEESNISLDAHLALSDVAIGNAGTSLFAAIVQGVPSICLSPKNACTDVCTDTLDGPLFRGDREPWLHGMSYKQFSLREISNGTAWELLRDIQ